MAKISECRLEALMAAALSVPFLPSSEDHRAGSSGAIQVSGVEAKV
jgi:hypothetical protein